MYIINKQLFKYMGCHKSILGCNHPLAFRWNFVGSWYLFCSGKLEGKPEVHHAGFPGALPVHPSTRKLTELGERSTSPDWERSIDPIPEIWSRRRCSVARSIPAFMEFRPSQLVPIRTDVPFNAYHSCRKPGHSPLSFVVKQASLDASGVLSESHGCRFS